MEKSKTYRKVRFTTRLIRRVIEACKAHSKTGKISHFRGSGSTGDEAWRFDTIDEILAYIGTNQFDDALISLQWESSPTQLWLSILSDVTKVDISSDTRASIDSIFAVLEEAGSEDKIVIATPEVIKEKAEPIIFVGHGRSSEWEKLKSHLQDKHNLKVISYESGARAGHTIRDILDSMSDEASIAFLVLTGEDKTGDGIRARQNVIHECGLFQGRLGFDRGILLVERGIELASNFDGIQQLRFDKDRISEVFGDVVATIRREFDAS